MIHLLFLNAFGTVLGSCMYSISVRPLSIAPASFSALGILPGARLVRDSPVVSLESRRSSSEVSSIVRLLRGMVMVSP